MLSRKRLVSTVVATHNRPGLVVRTLDCLARQTYPPAEVIVVDDGSRPATGQAITAWQRDREPGFRLIYHWQPNSGPAAARNRGVSLSSGGFIHFIDDDDLMHEGALESMAAVLDTDGPAVAMSSYRHRWEDGRMDDRVEPPSLQREDCIAAMIGGRWFVPIHGYLFTRAAVEMIGGWSTVLSSQEDDEYLLRAAMTPIRFVRAPEALVYYCQHEGVRRATPGKPGESVLQGLKKRLSADLAIREAVYERLQAKGHAMTFRHAFQCWELRLRNRYQSILDNRPVDSPLLEWLAVDAQAGIVLPSWPWSAGTAIRRQSIFVPAGHDGTLNRRSFLSAVRESP